MKKNFLQLVTQKINEIDDNKIKLSIKLILKKKKNNKIILAGNGASATISSHIAVDFTKAAGIRAINFNEAGLLTCFSNDYGYENWLKKALEFHSLPGDVLILISSSGNSKNIIEVLKKSKKRARIISRATLNLNSLLYDLFLFIFLFYVTFYDLNTK